MKRLFFLLVNVSNDRKNGIINMVIAMNKKINNVEIHYIDYGNANGEAIVLLHGWGQNIAMMQPVGDAFAKNNRIIILDLPGFGESEEPKEIWRIHDYAEMLHELLDILKVKNPILIGHSFGGKISLLYASKYQVQKLVLLGSPFRGGFQKLPLKTKILKTAKKIPGMNGIAEKAKKHIGSTDYKNASTTMRNILVDHVNLDISDELQNIKCPSILIWGTLDREVPLSEAYELEKRIPDAAVLEYEGCTHYAYLEQLPKTISIIKAFIKE